MKRPKRILMVDDDAHALFVLRHALARLEDGCEVLAATNGYDAMQAIQDLELDLLITDIRLPGPSGVALTEALRRCHADTPVIWITAHHDARTQAQAGQLGVHGYLVKPLEIDEIRAAVRASLAPRPS